MFHNKKSFIRWNHNELQMSSDFCNKKPNLLKKLFKWLWSWLSKFAFTGWNNWNSLLSVFKLMVARLKIVYTKECSFLVKIKIRWIVIGVKCKWGKMSFGEMFLGALYPLRKVFPNWDLIMVFFHNRNFCPNI